MNQKVSISKQDQLTPISQGYAAGYGITWRQRKLLVDASATTDLILPPLHNSELLINCLKRSPIKLVKLDLNLGEESLKTWANACHLAHKPAFLRIPSIPQLPQKQSPVWWRMKRVIDWLAAAILLLLLSPLMIWLAGLMTVLSPGPILFYQWRVGERGKLFKIIKFRTMQIGSEQIHHQLMGKQNGLHKLKDDPRVTSLGRWMRKYSLDELPQLLNVLRGEMSLVGPRPWALYDAMRISPELQHRLNALPGMTGAWQVQARSHSLDLSTVNRGDLKYLHNWSPAEDFKCLLLTIPKVLSGFGAY